MTTSKSGFIPQKHETVPEVYPFGSITDGDWVCGRCRESITGCALCAGEIRSVVRVRDVWSDK